MFLDPHQLRRPYPVSSLCSLDIYGIGRGFLTGWSIWAIGARDLQFSETSALILQHQKLSTVFLIYISCNAHSWWHYVDFVTMFTVWPMWNTFY